MDPAEPYHELYAYTMGRDRRSFILQHVVDASGAQIATPETAKPIGITFALVGLYLHVERGFSGRQVQEAHIRLGRLKPAWPQTLSVRSTTTTRQGALPRSRRLSDVGTRG